MWWGFVTWSAVPSCPSFCVYTTHSVCYWKNTGDWLHDATLPCTNILVRNHFCTTSCLENSVVSLPLAAGETNQPRKPWETTSRDSWQYTNLVENVLVQWLDSTDNEDFYSQWQQLSGQLALLPGAKHSVLNLCRARILACSKYSLYRAKRSLRIAQVLYMIQADFLTIVTGILVNIPSNTPVHSLSIGSGGRLLIESVSRSLAYIWSCVGRCDTETAKTMVQKLYQQAKDKRGIVIALAVFLVDLRYQCNKAFSVAGIDESLAKLCLYILAPAASYLGIWKLQLELEEAAFHVLHPTEYESLSRHVGRILQQRSKILEYARFHICRLLSTSRKIENQIVSFTVHGRVKGLYSIYKKMKRGRKLKEIYDLIALRIIIQPRNPLKEIQACYDVRALVEQRWFPVAYRSKDFIKNPKPNGYRALHTTVILNRVPFEVQIRTEEMHRDAEYGNSAHFLYKLSQWSESAVDNYTSNESIPVATVH